MAEKTLKELLEPLEWDVLAFKQRWALISGIQEKMQAVSVDGFVMLENFYAHRMVSDAFEMFVIDLASFAKSVAASGGLLPGLKRRLSDLARRKLPSGQQHRQKGFDRVFALLFPYCHGSEPTHSDVDLLIERWAHYTARIVEVRNQLHAHKHEREKKKVIPPPITTNEITKCFSFVEDVFNGLRLLSDDSTLHYHTMENRKIDATADDITDIILLGSIPQVIAAFGGDEPAKLFQRHWQQRDSYYQSARWSQIRAGWKFEDRKETVPAISRLLASRVWIDTAIRELIVATEIRHAPLHSRATEVQGIAKLLKALLLHENYREYESLSLTDAKYVIDKLSEAWGEQLSRLLLRFATICDNETVETLLSRSYGEESKSLTGRVAINILEAAFEECREPVPRPAPSDLLKKGVPEDWCEHLDSTSLDNFIRELMALIRDRLEKAGLWETVYELIPEAEAGNRILAAYGWTEKPKTLA